MEKQDTLEKFVNGMKKASTIIRSQGPDFIMTPVIGAVPFVDIFNIIDRKFPLELVEYPPNSSRFRNREELISRWYDNFLKANYCGDKMKVICVDEVVSGSSAIKGYQEFKKAVDRLAKGEKDERVSKKITYRIIGIAEPARRNPRFNSLVRKGIAREIDVGEILTMDNVTLNSIRLKTNGTDGQGRTIYLPEIAEFKTTRSYLTLLQNIAAYSGVDPTTIGPVNLARIKESLEKYLVKE